ncbi:hypothetical protein BH23THE1_BH23THE1_16760 [soil metagenome]
MKSKFEFKYADVIAIALAMAVAFFVVLMNLTGMWPCQLLEASGKYFQVDTLQNSTEPINKIIYDTHYSLKGLFRCG